MECCSATASEVIPARAPIAQTTTNLEKCFMGIPLYPAHLSGRLFVETLTICKRNAHDS
jgi:hypothetical protein